MNGNTLQIRKPALLKEGTSITLTIHVTVFRHQPTVFIVVGTLSLWIPVEEIAFIAKHGMNKEPTLTVKRIAFKLSFVHQFTVEEGFPLPIATILVVEVVQILSFVQHILSIPLNHSFIMELL